MTACRTDFCRLGPQDTESIDFDILHDIFAWFVSPWKSLRPILCRGYSPTWLPFHKGRHLEFLIRFLIGWNLWRPSWIWKTIESIVLETIAYCLSRLLIGYRSFKPGILVSFRHFTQTLFKERSSVQPLKHTPWKNGTYDWCGVKPLYGYVWSKYKPLTLFLFKKHYLLTCFLSFAECWATRC